MTCPPETALKKLSKGNIPVFKLKKEQNKLYFGVREEYTEKVFAIFSHPCYNISIRRKSAKTRFTEFLKIRFGLVIGGALFIAAALLSGCMVFKIKVTGDGSYLSDQVIALARDCGAKEWSFCRGLDKSMLQAKVMALNGVNFCSVSRQGAYLIIDVHAQDEQLKKNENKCLKANASGELTKLVVVCGTAEREVGEKVSAGDTLIGAYEVDQNGEAKESLAVGFAEIAVNATISLFYDSESEQNTANALGSTALYSDRVTQKSYTVKPCEGGVTYEVSFTYLVTAAINME